MKTRCRMWSFTSALLPCCLLVGLAGCPPLPEVPQLITPEDGLDSPLAAVAVVLDWEDAAQATSYDVYFGTVNPPTALLGNTTDSSWTLDGLEYDTTYYWQVVAKNGAGSTAGPVWSFVMDELPAPDRPSSSKPVDGAISVSVETNLDWADAKWATAYDVYFGTVNPPTALLGNTTDTSWTLDELEHDTTYYWQVVAKNQAGSTDGRVWSFTTEPQPNQPPIARDRLFTVAFNTPTAATLTASDPDTGPSVLTYRVVLSVTHGTLTGDPPQLTYTPSSGYVGFDSFTFEAYDGAACSSTATVTLMVTSAYRAHGLGFSPYVDGQDPNYGSQVSEEQLRARLRIVAPYTRWIRTFGCAHGLELAGDIARDYGLRTAIGAWLSSDSIANAEGLANLIAVAVAGQADIAIVGSEALLRGDLQPSKLIAYLNEVRAQVPADVLVTTADAYSELLAHPDVIAACDIVLANYYPYWEGIPLDGAMPALHAWHQQVVAAAGGKTVVVSESGWPSCGNTIGEAIPSPANATYYCLDFVSWARATKTPFFWFDALDESYKALDEGPQGACWGLWDKNGVLKPGRQDVFDGDTLPDNWTVPGGPGTPDIVFTHVPPLGSVDSLRGRVWHVAPADHRVVVYICVNGGWWIKPTFAEPLTAIAVDGRWSCVFATGGDDAQATQIAAFLIPLSYSPPALGGAPELPTELEENALDWVKVSRP